MLNSLLFKAGTIGLAGMGTVGALLMNQSPEQCRFSGEKAQVSQSYDKAHCSRSKAATEQYGLTEEQKIQAQAIIQAAKKSRCSKKLNAEAPLAPEAMNQDVALQQEAPMDSVGL